MTEKMTKGLMLAGATALISGMSVFVNGLVVKGIDPLVHTTIKNTMVGLMILMVLLVTGEGFQIKQLRVKDRMKLLLIGLVGGSIPFILFFTGLKEIGGVEGAIIHKTLVFWVAMLAVPLLGEKMSGKMMLGVLLLYLSNFMLGFSGFASWGVGQWMVLAATLLWAVENVIAKKTLPDVPVNVVVAARMALGALVLIGMLIWSGKAPLVAELSTQQWFLLLIVAGFLFGYVMTWYRALSLAPATFVAAILVGATVITTLLNAAFVKRAFGVVQLGQIVFIISGIWLVVMAMMDKKQSKDDDVMVVVE